MKFISVRDLRSSPAKIWRELPEEREMVITNNGKPIALLTPISDDSFESTLAALRQALAAQAVQRMQTAARESDLSGMDDPAIEAEIRAARRERHGRTKSEQ